MRPTVTLNAILLIVVRSGLYKVESGARMVIRCGNQLLGGSSRISNRDNVDLSTSCIIQVPGTLTVSGTVLWSQLSMAHNIRFSRAFVHHARSVITIRKLVAVKNTPQSQQLSPSQYTPWTRRGPKEVFQANNGFRSYILMHRLI